VTLRWWPRVREEELVKYLDEHEYRRLLAAAEIAAVGPGEPILRKGSPSRSLLLIDEGEVDIVQEAMGEEIVLASIGPGCVVGEVGFVDGEPRTHDVRARTACRLRRLTRERLLELVKDDPSLFAKLTIALAEILARRFRSAVAEFEPLRAFAVSLGEPLSLADDLPGVSTVGEGYGYDEIEAALPEPMAIETHGRPSADEEGDDPALRLIREVARRSRRGLSGV
jgi:hypothetical protein